MLECVHGFRKESRRVDELSGLKVGEPAPQHLLGWISDSTEELVAEVLPNHSRGLENLFAVVRETVNPGGQDGLHRRRDTDGTDVAHQTVRAMLADERVGLNQRADALFEEERVAPRMCDEEPLQRSQRNVKA